MTTFSVISNAPHRHAGKRSPRPPHMCGVVYHFSRRGGAVAGNHIFLLGIGVMSSRRGMTRIFGHGLPRCRQPGCKWDTHGHAGRRGRRPLPRSTPHPHGRARRPRRAVAHGTPSGTPTGTRAAEDVGPYHAPRHVRTRTPCAHLVGRDVLGAPLPTGRHRERPRARGPPGTSAPTTFHTTPPW